MGRTSVNKPMALPARAARFLDELLAAIAAGGLHGHERRSDRIALTVRPCTRRRDRLPDGLIEYDAWRLLCLSHRWCAGGSRGVRRRLPLAIYRPAIDLPGTGRIRFACERAYDAASRGTGYAPSAFENPSAARAAVLLHQAAEDTAAVDLATTLTILPEFHFGFLPGEPPVFEPDWPEEAWGANRVEVGGMSLWPSWMFARPAGRRWEVHPVDGSSPPSGGRAAGQGGRSADGAWALADGIWTPLCQEPAAVLADLRGLDGRSVRNPAWAVLRRHGLIPAAQAHRRWRDGLAVPDDPTAEGTSTLALREAISAYVVGAEDDGTFPRQDALMRDMRAACEALGVPVPEGREDASSFFIDLLLSPWEPVSCPGMARVEVVKLAGRPDPTTLIFRAPHLDVDLQDLGHDGAYYEQVPGRRVDELLRRRSSGRGAHPWREVTASP